MTLTRRRTLYWPHRLPIDRGEHNRLSPSRLLMPIWASGPLFSDWAGQQRRAVRFGDDDDLRQRGEHEQGVSAEAAGDGTIDDDCGGEQIDGVPPPQETEWPQSSQMSAFGDGCSQSQGVLAYDEDYKCTICLEMLHEPLKSPVCDHRFCHVCFYSAVKSAGPRAPSAEQRSASSRVIPPIDPALAVPARAIPRGGCGDVQRACVRTSKLVP